ncbi:MAG: hypothetical protein WCW16_02560 [Candidatus Magasanikbacteria bacterium]
MVNIKRNTGNPELIPSNQPVRFYKFIALSFLIVTVVLLGFIVFMSAKRAEISIVTRSEPINVQATVTIDPVQTKQIVSGFVTTTLIEAEQSFSPQGNKKEDGIAEGVVTLVNDGETEQALVATTRLLTPEGILFRMKDRAVVPAKGSIEVSVYADQEGVSGDIGPSTFIVPGLNEARQKIVYAKSTVAMQGGVRTIGTVNEDDIEKAEKQMLEVLKKNGSDELTALYPNNKGLFEVVQYVFENDAKLGEEASTFMVKGKATVVGVFYDESQLKAYAGEILQKQVVDNSEVLESVQGEPTVVLDSNDLERGTAILGVTHTGLVNIDPNSRELQKIMFFGKTEDEVRRYVMSLNHVQGVEMHFRPMWNRSVPHVADHVVVTIKQVE